MDNSPFDQFFSSVKEELTVHGFLPKSEDRDGPMGSGEVQYSSVTSELVLHSDRGIPAVTIGPHSGITYGYLRWAEFLGIKVDQDLDVYRQLDFILEQKRRIDELIEGHPGIDEKLRELNWCAVKDHLGLDPKMARPGNDSLSS
ncbi:MAG: hypothetical protein HKL80_07720 [Acidimicrobiales bacterium]|nr:hypothetical protein [Acidimicrobiales bacterium]